MWTDQCLSKLSGKRIYHREELFRIFCEEKNDLSDSAFRWTLYNLQKAQKIFQIGYDTYTTVQEKNLPQYRPFYSDNAMSIMKILEKRYDGLSFVLFESMLLNEFLNHQIAQNTVYVQVARDVSSFIFDSLQQEYAGTVLFKPGKTEFERYWTKDCIVVLELISQSPLSAERPHEITAEKMMVDIIADKSIAATFSPAELPFIYKNLRESYRMDERRMNRYAGRRGKSAEIKSIWEG